MEKLRVSLKDLHDNINAIHGYISAADLESSNVYRNFCARVILLFEGVSNMPLNSRLIEFSVIISDFLEKNLNDPRYTEVKQLVQQTINRGKTGPHDFNNRPEIPGSEDSLFPIIAPPLNKTLKLFAEEKREVQSFAKAITSLYFVAELAKEIALDNINLDRKEAGSFKRLR